MKDIQTVMLKNAIADKEKMLADMIQKQYNLPHAEARALSITMESLEIDIGELKRILTDIQKSA
jgi:hypothetical protein